MKKLEDTGINTLIRSIQDMLSNSYENNVNEIIKYRLFFRLR